MRFLSFGAGSGCFNESLPISSQPVIGGIVPPNPIFLASERVSLQREDTRSMRSNDTGSSTVGGCCDTCILTKRLKSKK